MAFLKVLLCVVLVVSLCPPFVGAFAEEADAGSDAQGSVAAQADAAEADGAAEAGDADDVAANADASKDDEADNGTATGEGAAGAAETDGQPGEEHAQDGSAGESAEAAGGVSSATQAAGGEQSSCSAQLDGATMLKAKAKGIHATLLVDASAELPAGAKLVITPLVNHDAADADADDAEADGDDADESDEAASEDAADGDDPEADDEGAVDAEALDVQSEADEADDDADADSADEDATDDDAAADDEAADDDDALADDDDAATTDDETAIEPVKVTGAQAALEGMDKAVKAYRAKKDAGQAVIVDAYAIEVVDANGKLVPIDDDAAKLTVALEGEEEEAPVYDNIYAVKRDVAEEKSVAALAETEFADADAAAKEIPYKAEATDVTETAKTDDQAKETTLALEGVQSIVTTVDPVVAVKSTAAAKPKASGPRKAPGLPQGLANDRVTNTGMTLNLFNYGARETNGWSGTVNKADNPSWDGINSTDGNGWTKATQRPFLFLNGGSEGSSGYNYYTGGNATPRQKILQNELVGDYPVLAYPNENGTSLSYLFDSSDINHTFTNVHGQTEYAKKAYMGVDGLFTRDEHGYLSYSSNKNYAYYDTSQGDEGTFTVYSTTYAKSGDNNYMIGFFPFDDWTRNSNDSSGPGSKDHFFGLSMTGSFTIPETSDRKVTYTKANGEVEHNPMLFELGGDDDMWVFIDGVLVLDMGGIHQPVHGSINFTDGTINLLGDPLNGRFVGDKAGVVIADDTRGNSALNFRTVTRNIDDNGVLYENKPVLTANISEAFDLVGKEWDDSPGSPHTISVFYLERGSFDSNLLIRFNLPLTETKKLEVSKEWKDRSGNVETNHQDSLYVQVYRSTGDGDDATEPEAYGNPVKLEKSNDSSKNWKATFEKLPIRSESGAEYNYTVKEGYVVNGTFIPADDGWIVSDGATYELGNTEYSTSGDDDTATITNERRGTITAEKQWLDAAGNDETADAKHNNDSVYVRLVKQTKTSGAFPTDGSGEQVGVVELNKGNGWRAGFDVPSVQDDNIRYIVQEGTYEGGVFTPSTTINAAGDEYDLNSISYFKSVVNQNATDVSVQVRDRSDAGYVNSHTQNLYWGTDRYQYDKGEGLPWTYWVNRIEADFKQLAGPVQDSIPVVLNDTYERNVQIPYSAASIPDNSAYDFILDIAVEDAAALSVGTPTITGLDGSNYTLVSTGDKSYRVTVPAAWAREHAGSQFRFALPISSTTALHEAVNSGNPAKLKIIPTEYTVYQTGDSSLPEAIVGTACEGGIQLDTGGTGHAVIANKPHVSADITLHKVSSYSEDTDLQGAKFVVLRDDGQLDNGEAVYSEELDNIDANRYPDATTEFETDGDGLVDITDLVPGTYWVLETQAPTGYVLNSGNPIMVVVEEDGTVLDIRSETTQDPDGQDIIGVSLGADAQTGEYTLTVPNKPIYNLPAASGPGTFAFLFAGAFAMTLAMGLRRRQGVTANAVMHDTVRQL